MIIAHSHDHCSVCQRTYCDRRKEEQQSEQKVGCTSGRVGLGHGWLGSCAFAVQDVKRAFLGEHK